MPAVSLSGDCRFFVPVAMTGMEVFSAFAGLAARIHAGNVRVMPHERSSVRRRSRPAGDAFPRELLAGKRSMAILIRVIEIHHI